MRSRDVSLCVCVCVYIYIYIYKQNHALIAGLVQFVLHLVQIWFAIGKSPHTLQNIFHALQLVWYRGLKLFHQSFAAHSPSYLTQVFQTLIRQYKGLYSTVVLSSLCAPWLTGAFWHCFASSTVFSWQQFCRMGPASQSFLIIVDVDTFFHNIGSVVLWCVEQSAFCHESWWLIKLSSTLVVAFGLPTLFLVFCLLTV